MLRSPEISTEDLEQLKKEVFNKEILGDVIVDYSSFLATFRYTLFYYVFMVVHLFMPFGWYGV
jgi:hypothetical protein